MTCPDSTCSPSGEVTRMDGDGGRKCPVTGTGDGSGKFVSRNQTRSGSFYEDLPDISPVGDGVYGVYSQGSHPAQSLNFIPPAGVKNIQNPLARDRRLVRFEIFPAPALVLAPTHVPHGWTSSLNQNRPLRSLTHNGPTRHLRTLPTILTTRTDHNPKNSTSNNNNLMHNNRIRTRLEARFLELVSSLPNRIDLRTLALVGTITCPINNLNSIKHNMSPPLSFTPPGPRLRTLLVAASWINICKMRLRGFGLNWSRFVVMESPSSIHIAERSCLWWCR